MITLRWAEPCSQFIAGEHLINFYRIGRDILSVKLDKWSWSAERSKERFFD